MLLILFCNTFLALTPAFATTNLDQPRTNAGVMDLRGWDFQQEGNVKLEGAWEFYWQQLLAPKDFDEKTDASKSEYVQVPGVWRQYEYHGKPLSSFGYATYRMRIHLDESEAEQVKSLYIPSVSTAYKLWVNGKLVATNGTVGMTEAEMVPQDYAQIVSFLPKSSDVEIVMQVANFVQRKAGLWKPLLFGSEKQIYREREISVTYTVFLTGSLFFMGIYHLILFVLRKQNLSALFFAILCLGFIIRMLVVGDIYLVWLFPQISWETAVKLEYLPIYMGVPLLLRYIQLEYPHEMNPKIAKASMAIGIVFSLVVLFTPAKIYTYTMLPYELLTLVTFFYIIVVTIRVAVKRRVGAVMNMIAIVLLFFATLSATLYYNQILALGDSLSVGVFAYLFAQSFILSLKFVRNSVQVEKLSGELLGLNASLERKVRERTVALEEINSSLQQANQEISRMEASRKKLLSNISHELGTPLDVIQGYLKAMLDGIIETNDRKYITLMYDKTVYLDRIIEDLFELSRLEAGQLPFYNQSVAVIPFLRNVYEKFELDVKQSGFRFELELPEESFGKGTSADLIPVVSIDSVRIEQVLTNFLVNAKKFTPPHGTITIRAEILPTGFVLVQVVDTGRGIAAEELPHIFERFFKGSGARQWQTEGVGLGLSIAREIIRKHGGEIRAQSTLGAGSTFSFTLPVRYEAAPPQSRTEAT